MTESQINYSFDTKRLPYTFWQKLKHFYPAIMLVLIPLSFSVLYLRNYFNKLPAANGLIFTGVMLLLFIVGIILFIRQINRLKFKSIKCTITKNELEVIVKKVADELEWNIDAKHGRFIIASNAPGFFSGSYGEQITILYGNNQVLVNSVCDPNKTTSVVSMGRNNKNERRLLEEIDNSFNNNAQPMLNNKM